MNIYVCKCKSVFQWSNSYWFFSHHSCQFTVLSDVEFLCFTILSTSPFHFTSGYLPSVTRSLFAYATCYPPCILHAHTISTCCFPCFVGNKQFCVTCIFSDDFTSFLSSLEVLTCAFMPSNTKYPFPQYFPSIFNPPPTGLLASCLFFLLIIIFLIKLPCISTVHYMAQAVICQQLIMKASGQSRKVHVEICHTFWKWD